MSSPQSTPHETFRSERALDSGWRFHLGEADGALRTDLDDGDWLDVRLPHDWAIACPTEPEMEQGRAQGFRRRAHVGWYRRRLQVVPRAGRRYRLRLDGAYRHAEVWVNGESLGVRPSGYATRIHDITDLLSPQGDQLLCVRCDNTGHDADRWYCGAGLYRRVWLTETADLAVVPWGVAITTPDASEAEAQVCVKATLRNQRTGSTAVTVRGEIRDAAGNCRASLSDEPLTLDASAEATASLTTTVEAPALWSPESPALYTVRLWLETDGKAVDSVEETFGIRWFSFTPDHGLELNGRPTMMKGVCMHHDLGCLGSAFFEAGWERRLRLLKDLGCNAIRTSHNPPDARLLDLCDRLGFMVIDEAYDKWREGCSGPYFQDWWQRDVEALVLRDRNHPCVLVWSIGNEVEHQGSDAMLRTSRMLSDYVKQLDPTRPTLVALRPYEDDQELWGSPPETKAEVVRKVADTVDIVGLNYQDQWYDTFHKAMPDKVFIATEAFHFYQHRDNASWAFHAGPSWLTTEAASFLAGHFLWTGIEYLGEANQGWPLRGWKGAPVDITGRTKPRAYWHASVWRDQPMVRAAVHFREGDTWEPPDWSFPPLVDHWNLPVREREVVQVWVFSNGHSVELLKDGGPQGRRIMADCEHRIAVFHVPYAPGTVTAISRDEQGNELARHELTTAGEPARLHLAADRDEIRADGVDLAHVTVEIVDENGVRVPHATDPVAVEVQGAARMAGMDNGDLCCHEPYQSNRWNAREGRCLAVLRAGSNPGPVTITAVTPNLPPASLGLSVG